MNAKIPTLLSALLLFALVTDVGAADDSFVDKFLGSPLLILAAMLVVVAIAFVYHRMRK